MKKSSFLKNFIILCVCSTSFYAQSFYEHILRVKLPKHLEQGKGLYAFYKGTYYQVNPKAFISDDETITSFSLIITTDIVIPQHQKNNPTHLQRGKGPCTWYDITKTDATWLITERALTDVPKRLPKNTIILYINPDLITHLAPQKEHTILHENQHALTTLPVILFKSSLTQEELNTELDYAALAALDLKVIHRPAADL